MQTSRNPAKSRPLSANVKRLMRLARASPKNNRVIKLEREFTARDHAYCHKQGTAVFSIHSGIPYAASAMLPVMAPIVSLSPPRDMAFRIASSKSVLSRKAMIACGTLP